MDQPIPGELPSPWGQVLDTRGAVALALWTLELHVSVTAAWLTLPGLGRSCTLGQGFNAANQLLLEKNFFVVERNI